MNKDTSWADIKLLLSHHGEIPTSILASIVSSTRQDGLNQSGRSHDSDGLSTSTIFSPCFRIFNAADLCLFSGCGITSVSVSFDIIVDGREVTTVEVAHEKVLGSGSTEYELSF